MSRTLDGLERDGLVRRQHRPGDMRVREVHATEAGLSAFDRIWPEMHAACRSMFAGLDESEYETLVRLLTRVLTDMAGDADAELEVIGHG